MTQDVNQKHEIAQRVKKARTLAGLTQSQIAKMLGLHRPSVSEMEAGNRNISANELTKIAEICDVEVSWLLGMRENQLDPSDPRLKIAARELDKLSSDDLDILLRVLGTLKGDKR